MSDYVFMLENHLNAEQSRALSLVRDEAARSKTNVFLTGGAMRDMLGGFPIRDLDFTVEGNAIKFAKALAAEGNAEIEGIDELKKSVELRFPSGVTVEIGMARQERYSKPGAKPQVQAASIHEDLRGRDFTVNSIGLSVSKASFGLLLDPVNGLADIERKELHAASNYALYDDPVRLLRLLRLKARLCYTISERTMAQFRNVLDAQFDTKITPAALGRELRNIAAEASPVEVLQELETHNLFRLFCPGASNLRLNVAALQKLQKAKQLVPFGGEFQADTFTLFLHLVTEKLSAKEKTQLQAATGISKAVIESASKLEASTKKLEKALTSPKLQKPSALYAALAKVPGEEILFLLAKSNQRIVVDRLRNYFQKYLPAALEITDAVVKEHGGIPGTPRFSKIRGELIAARLDARPRKVVIEEPPAPIPVPAPGRRQSSWGR